MTVAFELDGQAFTALNGGPMFKFNEAISFQVNCETQEEVDHYWNKLSAGGDEKAAAVRLAEGQVRPVLADRAHGPARAAQRARIPRNPERAMEAMLQMKKLDIARLKRAYAEAGD